MRNTVDERRAIEKTLVSPEHVKKGGRAGKDLFYKNSKENGGE